MHNFKMAKNPNLFLPDLNIELIANLAAEVSHELAPEEIVMVAKMAKQMGPDLSTGEIQVNKVVQ